MELQVILGCIALNGTGLPIQLDRSASSVVRSLGFAKCCDANVKLRCSTRVFGSCHSALSKGDYACEELMARDVDVASDSVALVRDV